jgi:hypothetical protein
MSNISYAINDYSIEECLDLLSLKNEDINNDNLILLQVRKNYNQFKNTHPQLANLFIDIKDKILSIKNKAGEFINNGREGAEVMNEEEEEEDEDEDEDDATTATATATTATTATTAATAATATAATAATAADATDATAAAAAAAATAALLKTGILKTNGTTSIKNIIVNSKYRTNAIDPRDPTSEFNIELSETLYDITKLTLTSVTLPFTWYNIENGVNNYIAFTKPSTTGSDISDISCIDIPQGYYIDISTLVQDISKSMSDAGWGAEITYDSKNDHVDISGLTDVSSIIFYSDKNICNSAICDSNQKNIPKTLGNILGFEENSYLLDDDVAVNNIHQTGESVANSERTSSIIIGLEDWTNTRDNSIIMAGANPIYPVVPGYYIKSDVSCTVLDAGFFVDYTFPRKYTKAQMTTIQAIKLDEANRKVNPQRTLANGVSNPFAHVPLPALESTKRNNYFTINEPPPYQDNGLTFSRNQITFKKPVNLSRFKITLYDENYNILKLNGIDWQFAMTASISSGTELSINAIQS